MLARARRLWHQMPWQQQRSRSRPPVPAVTLHAIPDPLESAAWDVPAAWLTLTSLRVWHQPEPASDWLAGQLRMSAHRMQHWQAERQSWRQRNGLPPAALPGAGYGQLAGNRKNVGCTC